MAIYKIKFDKKRCIACDACLVHCKVKNKVPTGLSLNRLIAEGPIADKDGKPTAKLKYENCRHCKKPLCVPASEGAFYVREDGLVLIDETKPISKETAQAIIEACPWSIPVFDEGRDKLLKCDFCVDRVDAGGVPACVTGCTTHALEFVRSE
jgi:Fe-S-cluster-containing dehydrogenase component